MLEFVNMLNGWVWSPALIYLCLGVGLYFSIRTRFLQLRHLRQMIKLLFDGKSSDEGVSSFQALAMSLAGRVGTGNIAGVATAITFGGPGALFWMWVVAFLGASTAFIESALGQIYKEKQDGEYRGGPAYYFEKGLGQTWYGILFAVSAILACGLLLPGVQANSIADSMSNALDVPQSVTAAIIAILLGFIIFGGVKRIAKAAEIIVPFMALAYIIVAVVIVLLHIHDLPKVLTLIFESAFGLHAGFGAMIGLAIQWGVKRGVYSNEAGQGTGPHPAGAANVSHPAKQGLVQAFSVYIDTLFVCSATGFMLLVTGMYNVVKPDGSGFVYQGVPSSSIQAGAGYTQTAMESIMPGFGSVFVALALFFFAFTTIMAYYYIAETNIKYLSSKIKMDWAITLLKIGIIVVVVYGSVKTAELAWGLGDLGVGLMAWLNIIGILFLQKPALACLKDYERQLKEGKDPMYVPEENGVHLNTELWAEIRRKFTQQADSSKDNK
ncbi:sodium:alanine symporter [Neisseria arctica]|uniref:Sodium:alanine symporter n=1 Tax=Neisseria arctica TaxID=1470200 RepID=A0A0J0YTQ9_9NEIS|nr:alanine/glycine:cation symporter family protein [Neisseria arctica]KLT73494.1 sodium:alanine symporter [Neisseria arctica]UOO86162.1 alanine:cation symporter family protein [Neisseria arctica]